MSRAFVNEDMPSVQVPARRLCFDNPKLDDAIEDYRNAPDELEEISQYYGIAPSLIQRLA